MKSLEIYFHGKCDLVANICHNVQENFKNVDVDESYLTQTFHNLLYHDVLLPQEVDQKFKNYKILWETVLDKKDEVHNPYQALHFVIPLSRNIPLSGNIDFCQEIAKTHFVNHGFAAQVDLHREDELDSYVHAHLLVSPYSFSQEGQELGEWKDIGLLISDGY